MEKIKLIYDYVSTELKENKIINIPIKLDVNRGLQVTAISLVLRFPNEYISINNISSDIQNMMSGNPHPNEIRIGWYDMTPINTFNIIIECKILQNVPIGTPIQFAVYEEDPNNPLNELAGSDYEPIIMSELNTTSFTQKATVSAKKLAVEYTSKPVLNNCSKCNSFDGKNRCTIGGFVVAKGGICKLYEIS